MRWGVIGAGDVVEHKSGPALQQIPGSSITAVMRRDSARAADFAARHGVARWYDDAQALVEDADVDAVYVATPPGSHAEHTIRAAAAGKHVYVEKPMGRTAAECEAMIAACERAGVGLHVAYYRRALPRFVAVREAVADGAIGRVVSVRVALDRTDAGEGWRLDPQLSGGGLFVDLASHTLDWLDLLLGPAAVVAAAVDGGPAERRVDLELVAGDVPVVGRWDFAAAAAQDVMEIVGTAGTVRFSCFGVDHPQVTTATGDRSLVTSPPAVVQRPLLENVVAALGGRAEPLSTGTSALRTTRVIDAVLADHRARHGITFG